MVSTYLFLVTQRCYCEWLDIIQETMSADGNSSFRVVWSTQVYDYCQPVTPDAKNKPPSGLSTLKRRGRPSRSEVPMSSQSYLADPQDEETGDIPMKKFCRTLLVNDEISSLAYHQSLHPVDQPNMTERTLVPQILRVVHVVGEWKSLRVACFASGVTG